jgi:FlaA1/EpsC-like NDP-sugar epimerase
MADVPRQKKPMNLVSMNSRATLALAHDVVAAFAAWMLAFLFRFNFEIPPPYDYAVWHTVIWVVPAQAVIFICFRLYRGMWRYASLHDLKQIIWAIAVAALAAPLVLQMTQLAALVPRSVLILDPILLGVFLGGGRLAYRLWKEHQISLLTSSANPVLVIGAGDAASNLIMNLAHSREWRIVGLLDDDIRKHGLVIHGVKVLGAINDLMRIAGEMIVSHAIVAMPSALHGERRRAVKLCSDAGLKVLTVPAYDDLVSGKVTVSQIRHVELDDLLGRDPVVLDTAGLKEWIHDRVIMVTGAGGSIGSELCRQLARFTPRQLVLFEHSEFALYRIEQEFRRDFASIPLVCAIGDVKHRTRVEEVMQAHPPSVIFHAAAYKHVPLMENENAWQAVLNNVAGTHVVARSAADHGVEKFVLISTDKAINPTSVMGASKRLAEMVCQALQQPHGTRFVMVRFGNVLGSTGSVIPKFREQIAAGGPVTITHPEIKRYFMSIPEAAQLVLQAGLMGNGGEIFVLDMGEPVLIADLARDLIRLSGFSEDEIKLVYTGLRPGEKLYEELLAADEDTLPTPHAKLRIARARQENGEWLGRLAQWLAQPDNPGDETVKSELAQWVSKYSGR